MLLPFVGNATRKMEPVLRQLILLLRNYHDGWSPENVPAVGDVWQCLQSELALEKFFWGRIQGNKMHMYSLKQLSLLSVNLGPGINVPSLCLTDDLGFLLWF